ncbi:hypothetical protein AXK56_16580 [Tsukamurella pulmonis]|uniref:Cutinase n=1 Tax=Tsukamurella pulmonis TaxID=47312 RepID=A0A1H1AA55_9ACTN|nr:cutinase family protein [Tsukamurella pulmonis]KXO95825.1 hypothetical protein AXK56_16580 [Tsukamurella pulmonis]SDQ36542.1 Cutinase [Tsukamurella pulmonis]SUQ39411.1 Cutinase [Tsukamurella pulmonis]
MVSNSRRTGAVVAAFLFAFALMGFGGAPAQAAPGPAPAPAPATFKNTGGCGTMQVIAAPGTTETSVNARPNEARGMLGGWGQQLQQKVPGAQVTMTPYPAQVGPFAGSMPLQQSRAIGVQNMMTQVQTAARNCPNTPIVLAGYSQGAEVAGSLCSGIGNGKVPGVAARQIRSCELFGDPGRGSTDLNMGGPNAPGAGALGNGRDYGELANRTYSACNIGDPYCSFRAQDVASGLGGSSGFAQRQMTQDFLNFKWPWAGSNGLPQKLADSLGSFAGLPAHTMYGQGTNFGGQSALGSSVSRLAGAPNATPLAPASTAVAGVPLAPAPGAGTGLTNVNGNGIGQTVGGIFGLGR